MSEFRSKPQPGDWTFPDDMAEGLDPVAMAVLSEHEYEGAPIPFTFQIVREISEDLAKAQTGDIEAAQAVRNALNGAEERYPDALGWNRIRSVLVNALFETGHKEEAFDTVWDISSPHQVLNLAFDLLEESEGELTTDIRERIWSQPRDRRIDLLRAMRDRIISHHRNKEDQAIIFNDMLQREGVESDPVSGWAESQGREYPNYDWDAVAETVRDDSLWGNLTTYQRQNATMMGIQFDEALVDDPELDAEIVDNFIIWNYIQRTDHPDVKYWDALSMANAIKLAKKGYPALGQKVALTIKDDQYKAAVGHDYHELGLEEETVELVMTMNDPHFAAELLLDTEWQDETLGMKKIEDVITEENYPLEQRIGFMEFIRDRMIGADLLSRAAEYQEQIDNLREELDN
ncbi:MAG: hypothetical protein ACXWLH_01400 [Candidatus Saccharimonadales bacterium]